LISILSEDSAIVSHVHGFIERYVIKEND